jgi:hypothetical protein
MVLNNCATRLVSGGAVATSTTIAGATHPRPSLAVAPKLPSLTPCPAKARRATVTAVSPTHGFSASPVPLIAFTTYHRTIKASPLRWSSARRPDTVWPAGFSVPPALQANAAATRVHRPAEGVTTLPSRLLNRRPRPECREHRLGQTERAP